MGGFPDDSWSERARGRMGAEQFDRRIIGILTKPLQQHSVRVIFHLFKSLCFLVISSLNMHVCKYVCTHV